MINEASKIILEAMEKSGVEIISHSFPFPLGVSLPKVGEEFQDLGLVISSHLGKGRVCHLKIIPMSYKKTIYLAIGDKEWGTRPEERVSLLH